MMAVMTRVTDEEMAALLATSRDYCLVVLHPTELKNESTRPIVFEHGRRNMELRRDGKMPIILRVTTDADIAGLGIFTTNEDETRAIMEEDPAVLAGLFTYDVLPVKGFPGDALPDVKG
jgi:hypothetical protein